MLFYIISLLDSAQPSGAKCSWWLILILRQEIPDLACFFNKDITADVCASSIECMLPENIFKVVPLASALADGGG